MLPWSLLVHGLVSGPPATARARYNPGPMPKLRVAVLSQGAKGAAVLSLMDEHLNGVDEPMEGIVAAQELRLFGADMVWPGDVLVGYGVPSSSRLDMSWHPFGRQSLIQACQRLLGVLRAPDAYGVVPVGFKSPPHQVEATVGTTRTQWALLPIEHPLAPSALATHWWLCFLLDAGSRSQRRGCSARARSSRCAPTRCGWRATCPSLPGWRAPLIEELHPMKPHKTPLTAADERLWAISEGLLLPGTGRGRWLCRAPTRRRLLRPRSVSSSCMRCRGGPARSRC